MKKIKTSELTGLALDWAASKAADWKPVLITDEPGENYFACQDIENHGYSPLGSDGVSPSTDWAYGGPIIESEGLVVSPMAHPEIPRQMTWAAQPYFGGARHIGATPLIAAMRCFVASRLGEEVEVPEELA